MQPPLPSPNRAIKTPPIMFLTGVFVFLGVFLLITPIYAASIFEDDFESYVDGQNLNGQSIPGVVSWEGQTNSYKIQDVIPQAGVNGANAYGGCEKVGGGPGGTDFIIRGHGTSTPTGKMIIWFRESDVVHNLDSFFLRDVDNSVNLVNIDIFDTRILIGYSIIIDTIEADVWYPLIIEWRSSDFKFRAGLSENNMSDWYDLPSELPPTLLVVDSYTDCAGIYRTFYFDSISSSLTVPCSSILNSFNCAVAGCVWHFWPFQGYLFPEINYCSDIPSGDCVTGFFDCPNCLTQETCEAQDCYWFQGRCSFTGGATCGEGLLVQFCENEGDCTSAGGFWYSDFCWFEEKPDYLLIWGDYYEENGDYETSSVWISGIASSTTGVFENIGSFLSTFSKNFNLTDAYNKGLAFGSAIPLGRSYLGILNGFTGNLPFGELFIFTLIFVVAVGVFRIVGKLFQILKFW